MIILSIHERELLIEILRAANNPDSLSSILPDSDHPAASDAIAKQVVRLQNWIDEEKSRERVTP